MEYKQTSDRYSCNVSSETNAWNRVCLAGDKPVCNVSQDTLRWNKACLEHSVKQEKSA